MPSPDWIVVKALEAQWFETDRCGSYVSFDEGRAPFEQIGIGIGVLQPGQASGHYHGEDAQEHFLVLSGECLLLIGGEERRLRAWDFVHCPPWAEHIFVGAGEGPC